jgi:hypothetical protein
MGLKSHYLTMSSHHLSKNIKIHRIKTAMLPTIRCESLTLSEVHRIVMFEKECCGEYLD